MLEMVTKILQHNPDGTVRELAATGAIQFTESKINSPGIHGRCVHEMLTLLRSIAGLPELDDNMLVNDISQETAKALLAALANGTGTIVVARRRGDVIHLVIEPTKTAEQL